MSSSCTRKSQLRVWASLGALSLASLVGCGDALVGGRCLAGYEVSQNGGCVARSSDPDAHVVPGDSSRVGDAIIADAVAPDGAAQDAQAGDAPAEDAALADGADVVAEDVPADVVTTDAVVVSDATADTASSVDGAADVPATSDAEADAVTPPDADATIDDVLPDDADAAADAAPGDVTATCATGETRCGAVCVDTDNDRSHCGACGATCTTGTCSRGRCVPTCVPPTISCGGVCIDPDTDEENCGACGRVCPSGVCNAGLCRDNRAGHVVLIGHSFARSRTDQDRILANAVYLTPANPARVLVYQEYSDASAVARASAGVTAGRPTRSWTSTVLRTADTVGRELSIDRYDVMLIHEQTTATDAQIADIASATHDALLSFVRAGGVVVVLDGATSNAGTWPIFSAMGVMGLSGATRVDGRVVSLSAPSDALAIGVSASYRAEIGSVAFRTSDPFGVFTQSSLPVVLHRGILR